MLEHFFDNHRLCDKKWCEYKTSTPESEAKKKGKFKSKVLDAVLYTKLAPIVAKHTHPNLLKQLQHPWNSQKNEALNYSISKVAPKDTNFGTSKNLQWRAALIVGVGTLGWAEYVDKCFGEMGVRMVDRTREMLVKKDKKKTYWRGYHKRNDKKTRRKERVNAKIKEAQDQDRLSQSQSLSYEPGMAIDIDGPVNEKPNQGGNRKKGKTVGGMRGWWQPRRRRMMLRGPCRRIRVWLCVDLVAWKDTPGCHQRSAGSTRKLPSFMRKVNVIRKLAWFASTNKQEKQSKCISVLGQAGRGYFPSWMCSLVWLACTRGGWK